MEVQQAIRAFRLDGAGGEPLLRAIVGHPRWVVPGEPRPDGFERTLTADEAGARWQNAFTDAARLASWCAGRGIASPLFVELDGVDLFVDLFPNGAAGLNLDPDHEDVVHYRAAQFALLRGMARTLQVERLVRDDAALGREVPPGAPPAQNPFWILRMYDGYTMLRQAHGWVLAPDAKGRRLGAVCCSEAATDALLAKLQRDLGETAEAVRFRGDDLFRTLAAMPLQGFVFDCAGPLPPKAWALPFATLVLDRSNSVVRRTVPANSIVPRTVPRNSPPKGA